MEHQTLTAARHVLASQPFSVMLRTSITRFDGDGATLELDIRRDLLQQNGFVHGGVLCYLADNAQTFAGGYALGPAVVTSGTSLTYLRPAQGENLIAHATVRGTTSRTAATQVEIFVVRDGEQHLVAVGSGTVSTTRREP